MNKRFYFTVQVDVVSVPDKIKKEDESELARYIGCKLRSCHIAQYDKNMHGGFMDGIQVLNTYNEKGEKL